MGESRGDLTHSLDKVDTVVVVLLDACGDGEDVGVQDDVLGRETDLLCEDAVGASAYLDLPFLRFGLALLVEGHNDHRSTIPLQQSRLPDELLLALLQAYRVDHRLALHPFQAGLDDRPPGRIDHYGYPGDVGLRGHEVEETDHRLLAFEHPLVHVDVYDLGAVLDLLARHVQGRLVVFARYEVLESRRTRDVGPFADVHEQRVGPDVARLEPRKSELLGYLRYLTRRVARDRLGYGPQVIRRRPAAAADDVQPAGLCPLPDLGRHHLRRLFVLAELVGQSCVRVGANGNFRDPGEFPDVLPQLFRSERAIQPHAYGVRVAHGVPESLGNLPRERAPASVGDRTRDHDGNVETLLFEVRRDPEDGGPGVQCVEDGLYEQQVDPPLHEPPRGLCV